MNSLLDWVKPFPCTVETRDSLGDLPWVQLKFKHSDHISYLITTVQSIWGARCLDSACLDPKKEPTRIQILAAHRSLEEALSVFAKYDPRIPVLLKNENDMQIIREVTLQTERDFKFEVRNG